MKRYIFLIVLLPLLAAGWIQAGEGDGGYTGAFLQVPIGARPTAMGGAYRAVSDDGAGVFFNPAGLVSINRLLLATSYRAMQLDRSLGYANFLIPVEGSALLGFSWLYAGSGSVVARDSDGYERGFDISLNSHDFAAVFAKRFEKYLSIGTKFNYYAANMAEMSASSIGFDMGAMLYIDQLIDREKRVTMPVQEIRLGLTVKYLGAKFNWNSEKYNQAHTGDSHGYEQSDKVPVEIGLGASARFLQKKLLLATDLIKNEKQGLSFHGGAEYSHNMQAALRAGFSDGRLTAGGGYMIGVGSQLLAIDYAFTTDKADEGSEHIFSFDLLF